MTVVCAYCSRFIREKDGEGQTGVSHGICDPCREMYFGDFRPVPLISQPEPAPDDVRGAEPRYSETHDHEHEPKRDE